MGIAHERTWLLSAAGALGMLVHAGLMIGLIIVAVVVVRRHRPDAWLSFLIAPVVNIVWLGLHEILVVGGARAASSIEDHMTVMAATGLLGTCVSVAFWVLMLVALVKLARPAPDAPPGMVPFR